ncbi:MAG: glycosyltransferase family 9 protein [Candidatus Delongbacteria bacterium]|nr:glycosyltransferase family 9 protein [Candidatus Delongbacteria bacterium]MBN2835950.1 glycosyltransferase family 9 protein [Candidatus Delongbacteria bacterium]
MKTLIINLTRMGDILQTVPLLRNLKDRGDEVHYLAVEGFDTILKTFSLVDTIHTFSVADTISNLIENKFVTVYKKLSILLERLKNLKFDICINLTHTDESRYIADYLNIKDTRGIVSKMSGDRCVKNDWANYFYVSNLNRNFNRINIIDLYNMIGDFYNTRKMISYIPDNESLINAEKVTRGEKYFCVQLGASVESKRWSSENFIQVAEKIYNEFNIIPCFIGTKSEKEFFDKIKDKITFKCYDLFGKTSVDELAGVLKKSEFLLTNDTGTMHIAAGVGTRIIAICLATAYAHETSPYIEDSYIFEADISCSPCSHHVQCTNPICKDMIKAEYVSDLISKLLDKKDIVVDSFNNVNVYKTYFDEYNNLRLKRLNTGKEEDSINNIFYHLFMNTFKHDSYDDISQEKYIEILRVKSDGQIDKRYEADFQYLLQCFYTIERLYEGFEVSYKEKDSNKISEIAAEIEIIVKDIVNFGLAKDFIRPLTSIFQFDKENMDFTTFEEFISMNVKVNKKFIFWLKIIIDLIH